MELDAARFNKKKKDIENLLELDNKGFMQKLEQRNKVFAQKLEEAIKKFDAKISAAKSEEECKRLIA